MPVEPPLRCVFRCVRDAHVWQVVLGSGIDERVAKEKRVGKERHPFLYRVQ